MFNFESFYISILKLFIKKISGRDAFPIFLKRRKLPRKFSISQPGNVHESDFYKDTDIEVYKKY